MVLLGANTLGLVEKIKPVQNLLYRASDVSNSVRSGTITRIKSSNELVNAFFFGIVVSIALGPCSLALVLPAIMMTMFNAPTAIHGGLQMLAFGVGHSLPVLVLSLLFSEARHLLGGYLIKIGNILNYILGTGLIILGFWLMGGALLKR